MEEVLPLSFEVKYHSANINSNGFILQPSMSFDTYLWGHPFPETTCASESVPGIVADTHNQYRMITKAYKCINRPTRVLNITRSYHSRCTASTADQPNRQLQRNGKAQPTYHRQLGCGRDLNLLSFSFILAPPLLQTLSDYTTESSKTEYGRHLASPNTTQGGCEVCSREK